MAQARAYNRRQLRAIFAKSKVMGDKPGFMERHPLIAATGFNYLGGMAAAGTGYLLTRKLKTSGPNFSRMSAGKYVRNPNSTPLAKLAKVARQMHPHLKGVRIHQRNVPPRTDFFVSKHMPNWGLKLAERQIGFPVKRGDIVVERNVKPHILAHELGHGVAHKNKYISRGLIAGRITHGAAPLASLAAQPIISRSNMSEKNKKRARIATAVLPFAMAAPHLTDEAIASYKGMRMIQKAGLKQPGMRRDLSKAFGSYLLHPAAATTFTAPLAYAYHKRDKRVQKYRKYI